MFRHVFFTIEITISPPTYKLLVMLAQIIFHWLCSPTAQIPISLHNRCKLAIHTSQFISQIMINSNKIQVNTY